MEKIAFKMKLNPGQKAEYIKRHAEIWPELKQLLTDNGVSDYTIFLDEETNILFGVQKASGEGSQDLGKLEIVQKWWKHMADIMETNEDNSPVTVPLENATRRAGFRPCMAAAAVRTLARTATFMPMNPAVAEQIVPTR